MIGTDTGYSCPRLGRIYFPDHRSCGKELLWKNWFCLQDTRGSRDERCVFLSDGFGLLGRDHLDLISLILWQQLDFKFLLLMPITFCWYWKEICFLWGFWYTLVLSQRTILPKCYIAFIQSYSNLPLFAWIDSNQRRGSAGLNIINQLISTFYFATDPTNSPIFASIPW